MWSKWSNKRSTAWGNEDFGAESVASLGKAAKLSKMLVQILNEVSNDLRSHNRGDPLIEEVIRTARDLDKFLNQSIAGERSTSWFIGEAMSLRGHLAKLTNRMSTENNEESYLKDANYKITEKSQSLSIIKRDLRKIGVADNKHSRYYLKIAQQALEEIDQITRFTDAHYSKSRIIRKIKPKDEHRQVVLSILNYFGRVIEQKHADKSVKVTTEQLDGEVSFVVEMEHADKNSIDDALYEYGMVVMNKETPEKLLPINSQAMELKHKLDMAKLELRHTTELLHAEREGYGSKIGSLEEEVDWLRKTLGEGLSRNEELQKIVGKIAEKSTKTTKQALQVIIRQAYDGLIEEDEKVILKELEKIKEHDPTVLDRLSVIAGEIFSGTTSGLLSSWIGAVITAVPK